MKKNSIMLKLAAGILITVMSFSSVMASEKIDIKVNGLLQPVGTEVLNKDGYIMVEVNSVFKMMGADIDWNDVKRCVTVKKGDKEIIINVDTNRATINEEQVKLPVRVEIIGNNIMIPLRFVGEALDAEVEWNSETKTVSINDKFDSNLVLDTRKNIQKDTIVLSYDEALEKAKNKSSNLKTLEDSIAYLDDLRDDLGDNLHSLDTAASISGYYPTEGEGSTPSYGEEREMKNYENTASIIQMARNIKSVDLQKDAVSVNEEMINDSIELMLMSFVNKIKTEEMNISVLEESIKLEAENIKNIELKNSLGYESDYNLETAKISQKTNESNLKNLKLSLENDKQSLKTLLGMNAEDDIYVEYKEEFDALDDINLESYIAKKKQSDPSIILLKNDVTIAEYTKRTSQVVVSESQIEAENNLKKAQRTLSDAQDTMEEKIRTTYNQLKQLEEKNKQLLLAVDKAKNDYNTIVASYQAGRKTIFDVNQAKLAIIAAQKDVEDNALNYSSLAFSFERPYLLTK